METVAVVGALGAQGSSVIKALRSSPATAHWNIRALTSSPDSSSATALGEQSNVTITDCDPNDVDTIRAAFQGCTHIYANTAFPGSVLLQQGQEAAAKLEHDHGVNLMRAAAETKTLKHMIWSTLNDCNMTSQGKWKVPHFMSKQGANAYILGGYPGYEARQESDEPGWGSLRGRTTLMAIAIFGSNFRNHSYRPIKKPDSDSYVVQLPCPPHTPISLAGDEDNNVGIMARAIFEQPELSRGTWTFCVAERISCHEWVSVLDTAARSQGVRKSITFEECSMQSIEDRWGVLGNEIGQMMAYVGALKERSFENTSGLPEISTSDLGMEKDLVRSKAFYDRVDCVALLREVDGDERHLGTASR